MVPLQWTIFFINTSCENILVNLWFSLHRKRFAEPEEESHKERDRRYTYKQYLESIETSFLDSKGLDLYFSFWELPCIIPCCIQNKLFLLTLN